MLGQTPAERHEWVLHPTALPWWGRQHEPMPLRWSLADPVASVAINMPLQKELFATSRLPRPRVQDAYKQRPCGAFSVARLAIKRCLSLRDKDRISLRDKGLDRFLGYSWESNPSGIGQLCRPPALAPTCGQKCPRSILRWYLCSKNPRCAQWHPVAAKYFDKLFPAINLPLMLAPPYSQLANDELCRAEAPQT